MRRQELFCLSRKSCRKYSVCEAGRRSVRGGSRVEMRSWVAKIHRSWIFTTTQLSFPRMKYEVLEEAQAWSEDDCFSVTCFSSGLTDAPFATDASMWGWTWKYRLSSLSLSLCSAQSLYHLPGPRVSVTGSRPISAHCQSSRGDSSGVQTRGRQTEGRESERSTHPAISPSVHRLSSSTPPSPTDRRTGSSLSLPPPFSALIRQVPLTAAVWLKRGGARQDARWDKRADTRCSAVANRRPPRCKCVSKYVCLPASSHSAQTEWLLRHLVPSTEPKTERWCSSSVSVTVGCHYRQWHWRLHVNCARVCQYEPVDNTPPPVKYSQCIWLL